MLGAQIKMAADLAASYIVDFIVFLAPQVGLEPTTLRLTAECSTIELLRNVVTRIKERAATCREGAEL